MREADVVVGSNPVHRNEPEVEVDEDHCADQSEPEELCDHCPDVHSAALTLCPVYRNRSQIVNYSV